MTYERTAQSLHDDSKPINIARWCWDSEQRRMRLLRGHASKSKTRAGRIWRMFWRIKRYGRPLQRSVRRHTIERN